jgi:hypothetical protein
MRLPVNVSDPLIEFEVISASQRNTYRRMSKIDVKIYQNPKAAASVCEITTRSADLLGYIKSQKAINYTANSSFQNS